MQLPADHPLNNDKSILREFILASTDCALSEEDIETRENALHALLLDITSPSIYDDFAHLSFEEKCLYYSQYGETIKEYYHDGSEIWDPHLLVEIHLSSKAEYEEHAEHGSQEWYGGYNAFCQIPDKWRIENEDHFFAWFEKKEYCFFAKNFLHCFDYIRIIYKD